MPTNGEGARRISLAGAVLLAAFSPAVAAAAQEEPTASPPPEWEATAIDYSNVPYPYPVEYLHIRLMGEDYRMAYMDVAPTG